MNWIIVRIFIYSLVGVGIYFWSHNYIENELTQELQKPITGIIFVDQNNSQATETGSLNYPFKTINSALNYRKENDLKNLSTIIIAPGTYEEIIEVPQNTTLFGNTENDKKINIINSNPANNTLTANNNTNLINLNITGGRYTIFIPYNTKTTIINSIISDAAKFGLVMNKNENKEGYTDENREESIINESIEELEKLPLVRFSRSTVQGSDDQGMYLKDGHIEIINSKIINNGEEGIDLHPHMYAKIINNQITENGESGIESEIEDNILMIEDNQIDNNIKNGIGLLTAHGVGKIVIKNNSIQGNQRFGIRCARHTDPPDEPRPFFASTIEHKDNTIENNVEGSFAEPCYKF